MVKASSLGAKVLIVRLDLLTVWVPSCTEIKASVSWSSLIEVLHDVLQVLRNHVVLANVCVHGSSRDVVLVNDRLRLSRRFQQHFY